MGELEFVFPTKPILQKNRLPSITTNPKLEVVALNRVASFSAIWNFWSMKIAKKITHETLSCIVNLMDRKLGQSCLRRHNVFF